MNIQTLENTSMQELADCFNLAFSDYLVPMHVEAESFAEGLRARGIRMDLSAGAIDDGRLVGFVLTCTDNVRGIQTAYNAGTGVMPAFRGQRLTAQLCDFMLPRLQGCGIRECVLEVLTENEPALRVYQSLGYRRDRLLKCYKGRLAISSRSQDIDIRPLAEVNEVRWQSFWDWQPTWQNGMTTIARSLAALRLLGAFTDERLIGYIAYHPAQKRVYQFAVDKDYRRRGIGRQLFGCMATENGAEISLVNIDGSATATDAFLLSLGLSHYASQFDMKLALSPGDKSQVRKSPAVG